MKLPRVLFVGSFIAALLAGVTPGVTPSALAVADVADAAAVADADHPFSDPSWLPLREPARISCATSNCDGPYHGYEAIDFAGAFGDPIHAAGAGIFHIGGISPGCSAGVAHRGTWVWVDHGPAGSTRYHHLASITAKEGQLVTPATKIGTMGSSGDQSPCETAYLHMELRDSETTRTRLPIPAFNVCVGGSVSELPQALDEDYTTWNHVVAQRHRTPKSDNSCMPSTWTSTPDRPVATVDAAVGAVEVTTSARPSDVDAVRVRLELFHPSTGEFGAATEKAMAPTEDSTVVGGLLHNRRYRALVSFHNSVGWSDWSTPVETVTGFLPSPPQFREHDSSDTTIGYKWHRGSNADADYTVAVRRANGSTWGSWEYHEVPSTELHIRLRGLLPGTRHQVTVRAHNEFGTSEWAPRMVISTTCSGSCPASPRVFTSLAPARLADSRNQSTVDGGFRNTGPRPGGTTWEIQVAGRGGVPTGAAAAIVNLTVFNGSEPGFATAYPCGALPTASSVNHRAGSIEPNELIVKLSDTGSLCVYTLTTVDVIVDVVGFIEGSAYRPLAPIRYADSRDESTFDGAHRDTGRRRGGTTWEIPIAGRGDIPLAAETAVVNLTATGAAGPGFATVYPCGEVPIASSLNFDAGITRANEIVTKLSGTGTICVFTIVDVDVVVDVVGYLGDVPGYTSLAPSRVADSRNETTVDGLERNTGLRPGGTVWEIPISGRGGVHAAAAVVANVTVTGAVAPGFLTVYDCGARPDTSSVNYTVGTTRPNETISRLSPGGTLCIYTLASTHILVDVVGFTDRSP